MSVGAEFSVCLGPDEQAALEAALLADHGALLDAFAHIDVAGAEAGNEADRNRILGGIRKASSAISRKSSKQKTEKFRAVLTRKP